MNFLFRRSHVFRAVIVLAAVFLCATAALAQADPRIVGGQEADPGEWPWQVALVQSGGDTYNGQFCGGSLIAANWVLTAAHCVYTSDTGDLDVVAGIHDLVTPDPGFVRVQLAEIIVHTGWDNGTKDNDVALLRLATPIPERAGSASQLPIQYVHLVAGAIGPLTGATTTVTGWGNRTPGGSDYPARLHEVEVLVIANGDCSGAYSNLTDNMLCAGVPGGGKDSCQGDSGGPLVYNNSGEWQQAGIVSFGIGCAEADYPGVYTRVSRYVDWITNAMNPLVPTNFAFVPAILHVPPAPPPSPLVNGDFEQGAGVGWSESSTHNYLLVFNDDVLSGLVAHSGTWLGWLGGDNSEVATLQQQVTVPAAAPVLSFFHYIESEDACNFDYASVMVNGSTVSTYTLCVDEETPDWQHVTINLSAYAGQNVSLAFTVANDSTLLSNLFIDDVSFTTSLAATQPPAARPPAEDSAPHQK